MKILLVGAGAAFSTKDVEDGYLRAFDELQAVELKHYALGPRLHLAKRWLDRLWQARGKPADQRPTWPDTLYRGGVEALEMALRFEVDWAFVVSAMYLHPDAIELMRRAGLRVAVLFTESPYEDFGQARVARLVEACWTTERSSVEVLRHANPRTAYLRHAYDPARHRPDLVDIEGVPRHDVVFVGTGFAERIELLEAIDWQDIDLGLYGDWSLLGSRHRLRAFVRGGAVPNETTIALYRKAKIGLNLYRSSTAYHRAAPRIRHAESLNPRAYELAACGAFQISSHRTEVVETFGCSVPTFKRSRGLGRLLRRYLADDQARARLALDARQRVLPHTFAARAAQVLAELEAISSASATPTARGA